MNQLLTQLVVNGLRLTSYVAPATVAQFYATQFCTPARKRPSVSELCILSSAKSIGKREGSRFWSWGEGPLILLVHGWGGHAGHLTEFVAPLVSAGFRVVAWEAPAHGESDGRKSNLAAITNALMRFAATENHLHAVIAHSLGGVATRFALARGLSAKNFVQIASPGSVQTIFDEFISVTKLGKKAAAAFQTKVEMEAGWRVKEIDGCLDSHLRRLPRTLLIHGNEDRKVDALESSQLAARSEAIEFQSFRNRGHRNILREARVISTVCAFLETGAK